MLTGAIGGSAIDDDNAQSGVRLRRETFDAGLGQGDPVKNRDNSKYGWMWMVDVVQWRLEVNAPDIGDRTF